MAKVHLQDKNSDHKFFSILQNILSEIGLTAYERSLYWAIKQCCGSSGCCTKSYANLAAMSGMKTTKLKETLASLAKPNLVIGKPLIFINNRKTESNVYDTKEITLACLWDDNIKHFQKKNYGSPYDSPQTSHDGGESPRDGGVSRHATGGESPHDYNKDTYIKIPTKTPATPTSSKEKPAGAGADFNKLALELIAQCKEKKFPFSEAKLYELAKKHGNALIDVLNVYSKKSDKEKEDVKKPDGWITTETRKQDEIIKIKKDYEI